MPENEEILDDNLEVTGDGEDILAAAIASLKESEQSEEDEKDEITNDDDTNDEDDTDDEADIEDEQDDEIDEEEIVDEPKDKKKQSKEENARFAAQRRQEELDRKVQEKLDEMKNADPNFLLAKQISELYGDTPENILAQMKEAQLQKQAEETKVPVEILRERQQERERLQTLENEINTLRYESWKSKIEAEGQSLRKEYTMLTENEIDEAVGYILNTAKNVDMPLEQAVYALHGKKIIEAKANAKVQDNLANQSGRSKKTPPSPSNGKASNTHDQLTDQEKFIAKQLGISFDDYLKNK